jgi:hypothetical protein
MPIIDSSYTNSAVEIASLNNVRVNYMRFEVLTMVGMTVLSFWVVAP